MSSSSKDSPKAPSESSDLSEPDSPPEITSSAVLFRGPPLSLFPSVARHIASKLALSPPSPLKVLDGASFASGKRYPDCYGTLPQTYELKCEDSMTGSTTEGNRRNSYAVQIVSGTGKRKVDYHNEHWDTIEAPNVVCPSPPSQMLSLFDGFLLYASDTLGEYKTELEDVFELFGGSVMYV
ncbi:hypothetical protein BDY24DRAFT_384927 [Mrakia frigida]|uniref:uncharacterized protein n=1 Tax=Mrakia frigida TaxID=29902 RepID=UPI003FCC2565